MLTCGTARQIKSVPVSALTGSGASSRFCPPCACTCSRLFRCAVCKGHVTPRAVEPERAHQRGRSTSQPCQHPEEAYTDARYRNNDSVCPVCAGWLPSKKHSAENKPSCSDAQERTSKAMDKVWGPGALPPRAMPRKWRTCGADEVWEQQGPHQGRSRPALQQRAAQRAVAHTERNPQQQYELGCRLEREGEDVTRPVADREADLQQAVGWFRAAAFQVQSDKISESTLLRTSWHLLTRLWA